MRTTRPRTSQTKPVRRREQAFCQLLERRMLLSLAPAGAEFRVNTFITSSQSNAAIAADGDGDFVVTWESYQEGVGGGVGIYAQRYNASGVAQGAEFHVNSTTTGGQQKPVVAMDADGDFVIVWSGFGPGDSDGGIFGRRYSAAGVPQGGEFRANTFITTFQADPAVASDAAGNFVVSWTSSQDGSGQGIYAQRYNPAGDAQGSEFRVNTFTTANQSFSSAAMDASGNLVIAWSSANQDGSASGVYAQRYNSAGVPQGEEFQVNTFTTGSQAGATVAMDGGGDFVVAWFSPQEAPGNNDIYAQRYNAAGVAQGGEFRVNTTTASTQLLPSVAMDADGDFLVTWASYGQDGSDAGVYAQSFNASAVPQGIEFRVNTFTAGNQNEAAVAMDADGNAVIAWRSINQDGSSYGVYAQRYDESNADTAPPMVGGAFVNGNRLLPYSIDSGPLTQIIVSFSENLSDLGGTSGANSITNPANWLVTRNGAAVSSTVTFAFNPAASRYEAVLSLAQSFSSGNFMFQVRDNVRDIAGNQLDGNFDAAPLGAWSSTFSIEPTLPPEFRVNTFTMNAQSFPSVAISAAGHSVVAWHSSGQDGSFEGVYAQRYNASGVPQGGEFRVNTFTTGFQSFPSVAMDVLGNFVVAWQSIGQGGVLAQRYSAAGAAQGGEFRVNTFTAGNEGSPSVAMDATGAFVVAWESSAQDGSGYGTYAQRYSAAGVPQGGELRVNTFTTNSQRAPSVAMDAAGKFVVAWDSDGQDASVDGVFARRYSAAGAAQGGEFRVNTFTASNQNTPSVMMDALGNFVVAWQSVTQDGSGYGVYAQRYSAAGAAQGGEFRVNTFTTGFQSFPSVAMDASGDFVVAWQSVAQDGDGNGVYAQRYGLRTTPAVGTLADTPDPVISGNSVTLSASSIITEPAVSISCVSFYRESNGVGGLQVGAEGDTLVGTTNSNVGGFWSISASSAGLAGGTYTYWAQATDDVGLTGAPASTTNTVIGTAPAVTGSSFLFNTLPQRVTFTFDQNVGASLSLGDFVVQKLPAGPAVTPDSLSYESGTNTATLSFNTPLPDGNYRATALAAGITNPAGTPLVADHVFTFFFLNGDANHDGRVNLADFNILAANFGQSNRDFAQGDFTYDTIVNLADFNVLASRFGQMLAAPQEAPAAFGSTPIRTNADSDDWHGTLEELT